MMPDVQDEICRTCRTQGKRTFVCVQCNNWAFCEECWTQRDVHEVGAVGWDGRPHEKSDPNVLRIFRQILDHNRSDSDADTEHQADEETIWFGVDRDAPNGPVLQDYDRFATLVSEGQTLELGKKYPLLVSFIGQTGAGKSTLIKMLIDRAAAVSGVDGPKLASPVTSSRNDFSPTTGDVHLYADPASYQTTRPILYADSEGLDGGETLPKGVRHRTSQFVKHGRKLLKNRKITRRLIQWAVDAKKKREYAVTQLYPRLLYTFSDVVVFVLRNPRTFESTVLDRLLEWASNAISKSLNQPTLPHVIIVLNATENVDEDEWDPVIATKRLLEGNRDAFAHEPLWEHKARFWRERGKKIETTKDLLECYYASITAVRVPARGRWMLMDKQVQKLFSAIDQNCEASYLAKKTVHMLPTAEKLQLYLQSAYDHFSKDLHTPFDFVREALKHNPIPRDFGGNILNLALCVQETMEGGSRGMASRIFEQIVPMLASCIQLDSYRQDLMGTPMQLYDDFYVDFCKFALDEFVGFCAPCNYEHLRYGPCCNTRSGHDKGHQNKDGKILAIGAYQSSVEEDFVDNWIRRVRCEIQKQQVQFSDLNHQCRERSELAVAEELHLQRLKDFAQNFWDSSCNVSYSACFSCLRELPEHVLPCGHVLCLRCIKAYGRPNSSNTAFELDRCPMHQREIPWARPWIVSVKAPHAGVRILCLDGGGVRGIVELQVLKAIQAVLGHKLPLQLFFDLIVGTSTGGIIALGLGGQGWSVGKCILKFKEMCSQAFTPRELDGVWGLNKLVMLHHGSKYKTQPFETVLKEAFDDRLLFGGSNERGEIFTKVAVTSTTAIQQQPVILANYNRPDTPEHGLPYEFLRSNGPANEFKMWEAARATSAAPPFFKKFIKEDTGNAYLDGALYHNCPVWVAHHERKMIWSDMATASPDILVSIGTGMTSRDSATVSSTRGSTPFVDADDHPGLRSKLKDHKSSRTFLPKDLWDIVMHRFNSALKCDEIWTRFKSETSTASREGGLNHDQRSIRINPDLRSTVPELDAVMEMKNLEKAATTYLEQNWGKILEVGHRLIASSFYFERVKRKGLECSGKIYCRFTNGSYQAKGLMEYLRDCFKDNFSPYFIIQEDDSGDDEVQRVVIGEQDIRTMCLRGSFQIDVTFPMSRELVSTTISLCLSEKPYSGISSACLPISGFPRQLFNEDKKPVAPKSDRHTSDHLRPHRLITKKSATDSQSDSSVTDRRLWLSALVSPLRRTSSELAIRHTRGDSTEEVGQTDGSGHNAPKRLMQDQEPDSVL